MLGKKGGLIWDTFTLIRNLPTFRKGLQPPKMAAVDFSDIR